MDFPGVAVVTGAAGTGIGSGVAKAFARASCLRIAITDVNEELLNETRKSISETHPQIQVLAVAGDVSSETFMDSFIAKVLKNFNRVDYCVNCAGILGKSLPSTEMSIKDFDRINSVNYRGCWLSSRAELNAMLNQDPLPSHDSLRPAQRGSIVNIASQLALVGRPSAPAYSASKAAVTAMTRADAIDYSLSGIRVNCICPGIIETPMTMGDEQTIKQNQPFIDVAPVKRMGQVNEVADCALFLSSTRASFVQGHAMVVDGGYTIV